MQLRPDSDFLLACARRFAGTQSADGLRARAARVPDWESALELARAHGMEPLAAWYLNTDCNGMLAPQLHRRLHEVMRRTAAASLLLSAELIKVLNILQAHHVQAVPLKGPVLAAMLCDEIAWRESCDLDLLVRRADIARARQALCDAGYRVDSRLPPGEENARFHWRSQLILWREGGGPAIDLHWQLLPSLFPAARYFDSVWERLETAAFQGREMAALCPLDQLFFLCAHAARHSWHSLRQAADIARLIAVRPDLDWQGALSAARRSDAGTVLALGLWMVNRLLLLPLPELALRYANDMIDGKAFARKLIDRMPEATPNHYETSPEFALQFKLAAGWWPKLRCAAGFALLPTDADGELRLPAPLFFLYYLLRPARLTAKYSARFLRRSSTTGPSARGAL
jgi:hypothetical protein